MASFTVPEKTSALYTATLVDETGAVVPAASLSALTLTLSDKATGSIINGRTAQNVLNQNDVTIDANGNLSWTLRPADNAIVTDATAVEAHEALFTASWSGGAKSMNWVVTILVKNYAKVT